MALQNITPLELYMVVKDAELIRRLMENHRPNRITARQMSRDLGFRSHSYMNRILAGDVHTVSTETGIKIAFLLGVTTDVLFVTKASSDSLQNVRERKSA